MPAGSSKPKLGPLPEVPGRPLPGPPGEELYESLADLKAKVATLPKAVDRTLPRMSDAAKSFSEDDFVFVKVLGRGSFGKVRTYVHMDTHICHWDISICTTRCDTRFICCANNFPVCLICACTVRPHLSAPQISSSLTFCSSFYWSKSAIILLYTILQFPHLSSSLALSAISSRMDVCG